MGVRKVSNSKRDLQGHSRVFAIVPFDRPHTIFLLDFHIAIMSLSYTVSEILSLISPNLRRSRDPEHIPFGGNLSYMYYYTSVPIITRHLKCPVSLIPKI